MQISRISWMRKVTMKKKRKRVSITGYMPVALQGDQCIPIGKYAYLDKEEATKKWDGWGGLVAIKEVRITPKG